MGKTLFLVFLIFVYAPITPCRAAIQQSDSMYDTSNRDFGDSQNTDNNMGGMDENSGYGANDYNNFGGGMGSSMPRGSFNQSSSNFGGSMGGSTPENSMPENSSNQDASASDPNAGTDMLSHMTLDQRARYWHMQEEKLKQAEDKTLRDHPGDFGGWFWGLGIGYAHTNTATNTAIYSGSWYK